MISTRQKKHNTTVRSFALLPIHEEASGIDFSEGLVAVRVNGKVGFMDKSGNIVIEPKYDDVFPFSEGRAPVELKGKWGYIDKKGSVIVPIQYDIGHMFSEGLASVEAGGKWGYIDPNGHFGHSAQFRFCHAILQRSRGSRDIPKNRRDK